MRAIADIVDGDILNFWLIIRHWRKVRLRKNLKGILRLRLRLGSSTGEQEAQGIYMGWGYDLAVEQRQLSKLRLH